MNKSIHFHLFKKIAILASIFILGSIVGWQIDRNYGGSHFDFRKIHLANNNFKFINPLLGFDVSQNELKKYSSLDRSISDFINSQIDQKKASVVSLYFRDLEKGGWFGTNENDQYEPASLTKVAIMIAYLKKAQSNPQILKEHILYKNLNSSVKYSDTYNKSPGLKEGNYYAVEELINGMIINSDNIAKDVLISNIDSAYLVGVFSDLGLKSPADADVGGYKISPQAYSMFFRILYNSTYLDTDFSELAMQMLSKTSFKDGLVDGVPSGISVAHKFGETKIYDNTNSLVSVELHDCGIVFYPKEKPYFLCVMTKGANMDDLAGIIKNISARVFDYVKTNQ